MSNFEFAVPCLFGLEGLAGDELKRMDMENVRVENGRVLFSGDERAMAKANVCLRTGERVLLTPHISGNMSLGITRDLDVSMFCEDLENYAAGRPLKHLVDRKLGY